MNTFARIKSAAGEVHRYEVDPSLPRYNGVPVCTVGQFTPCGWFQDRGVFQPTAEYFHELVKNYDPTWFIATFNTDHWRWGGPSMGLVRDIYVRGSGADALLIADMFNLEPELADQIDAGQWPTRSIEWVDAHDDLAFWQWYKRPEDWPVIEDLLFYGRYARYFTGLAALGLHWPAVPGLGAWPARNTGDTDDNSSDPAAAKAATAYGRPLAAHHYADTAGPQLRVRHLINTQEDPMNNGKQRPGANNGSAPTEERQEQNVATLTAENERLARENAELRNRTAQGTSQPDPQVESALKEARERGDRLEAMMQATQRETAIRDSLTAHVNDGRLTAQPQRDAYTRLARFCSAASAIEIVMPDGSKLQAGENPLEDLDSLIRDFPAQVSFKPAAGREAPGTRDRSAAGSGASPKEVVEQYMQANGCTFEVAMANTANGTIAAAPAPTTGSGGAA